MNRPIEVAIEDCKNEIIQFINKIGNENHLSYYFIETIINNIHQELIYKKESELKMLRQSQNKESEINGEN